MTYEIRRPDIADHEELDLSKARRIFVFGDLHGRIDLLKEEMTRHNVDGTKGDVIIGLGDWLDRGINRDGTEMDIHGITNFIRQNPNVLWIRGNHEQILEVACFGDEYESRWGMQQAFVMLIRNGGLWFQNFITDEDTAEQHIIDLANDLNAAPVAMTIHTPAGNKVGLVHACVPTETWQDMVDVLEGRKGDREDMAFDAMWQRAAAKYAIGAAEQGKRFDDMIVSDVDHVFYGHTIVGTEPVVHGNQSWIDTGAYKTNKLTFVEIDEWIEMQRNRT